MKAQVFLRLFFIILWVVEVFSYWKKGLLHHHPVGSPAFSVGFLKPPPERLDKLFKILQFQYNRMLSKTLPALVTNTEVSTKGKFTKAMIESTSFEISDS